MISPSEILAAKILIVGNEEATLLELEELLKGGGYSSVSVSADLSKVCALHRAEGYSLILLDLMAPGLDGFQMIQDLREAEAEIYLPVFVITHEPDYHLPALKTGAKDFVHKPFDSLVVLLRVQNLIEARLLYEEAQSRIRQAETKEEVVRASENQIRLLNQTLEERVNLRTAQLQEANKELQAFSYSVSHDLRAPVRHVLGFANLLKKDLGPSISEENRSNLETIANAATRMGTLIDDLIAFSHAGQTELQKRNVDLDSLVRETLHEFRVEISGREIEWQIEPLPTAWGDRSLLGVVLTNLISNAIKYTGTRPQAKIEIGSFPGKEGDRVYFVRDNGAGFNPKYSGKLFTVFQRLHSQREFEGTGIGLANVKRIVTRHGGRIWAEGAVNSGAAFYFSIPEKSEVP